METNNDNEMKAVVTRLGQNEIDAMKAETGAIRDGAAVAAYCRKKLREAGALVAPVATVLTMIALAWAFCAATEPQMSAEAEWTEMAR